jgi:hypothetical protein
VRGVVWKTYRCVSAWGCVVCFLEGLVGWLVLVGMSGNRTWEVTVKGPNLMSLFVRDAIFSSWAVYCLLDRVYSIVLLMRS